MKKHSKSLFLSLLIHTLLFASLLYAYTAFSKLQGTKERAQKVCIKLATLTTSAPQEQTKPLAEKPLPKQKQKEQKKLKTEEKKRKKSTKKEKKSAPKKVLQKKKTEKKKQKKPVKKVHKKEPKVKEKVQKKATPQKKKCQTAEKTANAQKSKPLSKTTACKAPKKLKTENTSRLTQEEIYLNKHLNKIVSLLQENLYYPRRARKRGIEGVVKVSFTILPNGHVSNIHIINAKHEILKRATIKTLQNLSGSFPHPQEKLTIEIPISYKLTK